MDTTLETGLKAHEARVRNSRELIKDIPADTREEIAKFIERFINSAYESPVRHYLLAATRQMPNQESLEYVNNHKLNEQVEAALAKELKKPGTQQIIKDLFADARIRNKFKRNMIFCMGSNLNVRDVQISFLLDAKQYRARALGIRRPDRVSVRSSSLSGAINSLKNRQGVAVSPEMALKDVFLNWSEITMGYMRANGESSVNMSISDSAELDDALRKTFKAALKKHKKLSRGQKIEIFKFLSFYVKRAVCYMSVTEDPAKVKEAMRTICGEVQYRADGFFKSSNAAASARIKLSSGAQAEIDVADEVPELRKMQAPRTDPAPSQQLKTTKRSAADVDMKMPKGETGAARIVKGIKSLFKFKI